MHFQIKVENMETYPPVSFPSSVTSTQFIYMFQGTPHIRVSRDFCRVYHGVRQGTTFDDASVDHASPLRSS